jgi:hypothetical protein
MRNRFEKIPNNFRKFTNLPAAFLGSHWHGEPPWRHLFIKVMAVEYICQFISGFPKPFYGSEIGL